MKVYKIKKDTKPVNTVIDYQVELNQEQYDVVTQAEGPCLVLAGAGSGKTRTIVYRVAYLIEHGIDPKNILLLTFTNKASKEMIGRVESLLKKYPEGLWAGTFHHIANRILRKYAQAIGYKNNFNILDSSDSVELIKMCIKDLGIDPKQRRFPSARVIQDLISYHNNSQLPLNEVIEMKHPKWADLENKITDIAKAYEEKKKNNQVMDFDDLLLNTVKLLKINPLAHKSLAGKFGYILVDEYQDTNYLQAELVKLLSVAHNNVLVVGDDAQSIYSFRAADIGNILNFPKLFKDTKVFKLETNYRSTPDILDVANDIILNNARQYVKQLKSVKQRVIRPQLIPCSSAKQEAEFISSMILQLNDEGVSLNKMAVLFRASHHSQTLEMELNKKDIPYDYRGGVRFFERAHIKDVVAFLKLFNNLQDEISWHRVLNLQVGIGTITADKIVKLVAEYDQAKGMSAIVAADLSNKISAKALLGWNNLVDIFKQVIKIKEDDVADMIRAISKSEYQNYLEAQYPDYQQRLQDLEQFALFAESYNDLNKFLGEVTLQEGFAVSQGKVDNHEDEKLILTTIHQAKGLEWQVVFVINLVDNAFPNQRALQEFDGLEEERRLFYVAVTRAEEQLFLTYPLIGGFDGSLNQISQFIIEIDQKKLEKGRIEEDYIDGDDLIIEIDEDGNRKNFLPNIDNL